MPADPSCHPERAKRVEGSVSLRESFPCPQKGKRILRRAPHRTAAFRLLRMTEMVRWHGGTNGHMETVGFQAGVVTGHYGWIEMIPNP